MQKVDIFSYSALKVCTSEQHGFETGKQKRAV
jgi:hypothetical protein